MERTPFPPEERRPYADKLRVYFAGHPRPSRPFHIAGASVILYQGDRILLQKRRDNGCWGYHGGRVELGERVEDAAQRELQEETGLTARSLTLLDVFSGPELHHVYPDGNEVYIIDTVFLCDDFTGTPVYQQEECTDLQWFHCDALPGNISPPNLPALRRFLAGR